MGGFVSKVAEKVTRQEPPRQAQQVQKQAVEQAPKGPTAAEVDDFTKRKLATNRRGRRATILTSTKGVDEDLALASKSLLG